MWWAMEYEEVAAVAVSPALVRRSCAGVASQSCLQPRRDRHIRVIPAISKATAWTGQNGRVFDPSRSSLITALKRLLKKGYLEADLKKSITGYLTHYKLTSAGKELLAKCRKDWRRAINGIEPFLEAELDSIKLMRALGIFQQAGGILRRHSAEVPFLSPWVSVLEQVEKISKEVNST